MTIQINSRVGISDGHVDKTANALRLASMCINASTEIRKIKINFVYLADKICKLLFDESVFGYT